MQLIKVAFILLIITGLFSPIARAQTIPSLDEQLREQPDPNTPLHDRDQGDQLLQAGNEARSEGKLTKAIALWEKARTIYDQLQDNEASSRINNYLGLAYIELGRLPEAEIAVRRYLALTNDLNDFFGQIYALNNLGTILLQRENFNGADYSFNQALLLARNLESNEGQGLSLSNLGLLNATQKNYARAIDLYQQALTFRRRFPNPAGMANTLNNSGDAYQALGRHKEALSDYRLALWYAEQGQDLKNQFRALRAMTTSYTQSQRLVNAFKSLDRWINLARRTGNLEEELDGLHQYARYYTALRDGDRAKALYENAILVARRLQDQRAETQLLNELSQILYNFPFSLPPQSF